MKKIVLLFIGFFILTSAQAEIYKYTNKQGKTAFSDVRVKDAVKVVVPPVMTYKPLPIVVEPVKEVAKQEAEIERVPYQSLKILKPEQQGTVRDNQGNVAVAFDLKPKLQKGDKLELFIDGNKQPALIGLGIDRGKHILMLQVVDKAGTVWLTSETITFFLHHSSKLINPQTKPVKKKPKPVS